MTRWRNLGAIVLALAATPALWGQTVLLAEAVPAGNCYRIEMAMSLAGEIRVTRNEKVVPLPLTATASHAFAERLLLVEPQGLPQKSARVYDVAEARITANGNPAARTLRPERRLLVAQRGRDRTTVYCPTGPLTREELQLTAEHLDTLFLPGLLADRPVTVGATWKVSNTVVQGLCAFEGLISQDLTCKLESVQDDVATVSVSGKAEGIELGAAAKLEIQATYRYDLGKKCLTALQWKQKDERQQGPASPATVLESTTQLRRVPIEAPATLSDVALVKVPDGAEPPALMLNLYHRDPKGRFDLNYSRDWHIVGQTDDHLVLRLMDRGDFVAQATVTPWTPAKPGEHLSPDDFRAAMSQTPGWVPDQELQADELRDQLGDGYWGYRISAVGTLDELKVTQNFYLVASPTGQQVVVAFTMNPTQVEKLGTRDLSFVGSLNILGSPPPSK